MAFKTSTEVIAEFLNHFPDCDSTSAASFFLDAIQELSRDVFLYSDSASIVLTAGTREYALSSSAATPWYGVSSSSPKQTNNVVQFKELYYLPDSTTSPSLLTPITEREIESLDPNWRYADSGAPKYWYIVEGSTGTIKVGLYPTPDTSTTAATGNGYPRVDTYYRMSPITESQIPDQIRSYKVVLYYMCLQQAMRASDTRFSEYKTLFEEERGRALKSKHGFQQDNGPRIVIRRARGIV